MRLSAFWLAPPATALAIVLAGCPGPSVGGLFGNGGSSGASTTSTSGTGGASTTSATGSGAGQTSSTGAGTCLSPMLVCGGQCTDVETDASNCGACGNVCMPGATCAAGQCTCPSGQVICNGACTDLGSDSSNCGGCNQVCAAGLACSGGTCACPSGESSCAGAGCVDLSTDPQNCGHCGHICPNGDGCMNGSCGCPSGSTTCPSGCVDTNTDPQNCGGCGNPCDPGETCSGGNCVCAGSPTDPDNCGSLRQPVPRGLDLPERRLRLQGHVVLGGQRLHDPQEHPGRLRRLRQLLRRRPGLRGRHLRVPPRPHELQRRVRGPAARRRQLRLLRQGVQHRDRSVRQRGVQDWPLQRDGAVQLQQRLLHRAAAPERSRQLRRLRQRLRRHPGLRAGPVRGRLPVALLHELPLRGVRVDDHVLPDWHGDRDSAWPRALARAEPRQGRFSPRASSPRRRAAPAAPGGPPPWEARPSGWAERAGPPGTRARPSARCPAPQRERPPS